MKATQVIIVVLSAAIVGAVIDRLLMARRLAPGHAVSFEVQDVKWDRKEQPTFVTHHGSARIVGKGEAATGRYLALVEFIRSQRVNPADPPDTSWETVLVSQGSGEISGDDQAYGCNWSKVIRPPECTLKFRDLVARWQVAGWVRLAEPAPDSGRSH
jgi:hypothetical protein